MHIGLLQLSFLSIPGDGMKALITLSRASVAFAAALQRSWAPVMYLAFTFSLRGVRLPVISETEQLMNFTGEIKFVDNFL